MPGQVATVTVEGYLSIRSAEVELRDLNVLVGANGSGKSNFVSALELLGRIVDEDLGLYVGRRGGASALLHRGESGEDRIVLDVDFPPNGYRVILSAAAQDELIFEVEEIRYHDAAKYEQPWVSRLGQGHRETLLHQTAADRPNPNNIAAHIINVLRGCRVFHFHDTSADAPVKRRVDAANNRRLAADAGNLAPFLAALREQHPERYERIRATVAQVAPFFRDFVLEEESSGRMRLRWRQAGVDGDFGPDALSDGTLRFICLATLLLQPAPPRLIVLDEPELGLHPYAIVVLADMLRSASRQSQVVVATQSVTLMNQFDVEDLVVVGREDGASTFARYSADQFADWLAEYSVGELWEKNLLGGRPIREPAE